MKKQLMAYFILALVHQLVLADAPCPLPGAAPCGVEEVISCARVAYNAANPPGVIPNTNQQFYDTQLFDAGNQDGFCKYKAIKGTYPLGVTIGTLTQTYYDQFCSAQTGTYFSYTNFLEAATISNTVTQQSAFGGTGGFACSTAGSSVAQNTALSTQEVVNFFASEAQETTSAAFGHTTDGLYYRYENEALVGCPDLNCKTQYYPPSDKGNYVGVSTTFSATDPLLTQTYTPYLWLLEDPETTEYYPQYEIAYSPMKMPYPFTPIPLLAASPTPSNSQLYNVSQAMTPPLVAAHNINETGILYPGMYVGMGSLQLTGSSMYFYYGWYENNLASNAPVLLANLDQFIGNPKATLPATDGFLRNGVTAFEGAFWYWMYRSIGINTSTYPGLMIPTLHQLAMDINRPACGCVGAVTLMINGGCNDFDSRYKYSQYFSSKDALSASTPTCTQTVILPGASTSVDIDGSKCTLVCPAGYTLQGDQCIKSGVPPVPPSLDVPTQNLLTYCQTPISGDYP